jgi:subtilisin family serine protease
MLASPKRLDIPVKDGETYEYFVNAGFDVQVYVMDTGIRTTHDLFGGRARHFGGLGPNDMSPYVGSPMADKRRHGT